MDPNNPKQKIPIKFNKKFNISDYTYSVDSITTHPETDDEAYMDNDSDNIDNDSDNEENDDEAEEVDFRGAGGKGESLGDEDTDESDSENKGNGEDLDVNERQEEVLLDFMDFFPFDSKKMQFFIPDDMIPGNFAYISSIIIF